VRYDYHKSVLVRQVLSALKVETAERVIDATVGDAGLTLAILSHMPAHGKVLCIDRDRQAIARATQRLVSFEKRFTMVEANFKEMDIIAARHGLSRVDGIVADLGLSRLMISDPMKGFMYTQDGPLSMKMGDDALVDAEKIVNEFSEREIANIIYQYGEEKASRRIAKAIVCHRRAKRITSTAELANVIRSVVRSEAAIKTLARSFQGLRIFINQELENLQLFLPQAVNLLRTGGRLVVLTYNSLEDRLVKDFIKIESSGCICPPDLPVCACNRRPRLRPVGRYTAPDADEIKSNPNARSAKMRVAEKIEIRDGE
jgi:16S rRNA (cytosine1402-N4)-methyltransferase